MYLHFYLQVIVSYLRNNSSSKILCFKKGTKYSKACLLSVAWPNAEQHFPALARGGSVNLWFLLFHFHLHFLQQVVAASFKSSSALAAVGSLLWDPYPCLLRASPHPLIFSMEEELLFRSRVCVKFTSNVICSKRRHNTTRKCTVTQCGVWFICNCFTPLQCSTRPELDLVDGTIQGCVW